MKTAINIYVQDLKSIATNPAILTIIIGLIILPSMYAWFNIGALIDPYGNAANLPIGIISSDQGASVDDQDINVGDLIIEDIESNEELNWQFADSLEDATDKVNTGEYYALIVIPTEFSQQLVDAIDTYQSPSIDYIVNEKVNAIAPKMTEAGAEGIISAINSSINGVVTETLVDYSNEVSDAIDNQKSDYEQLTSDIDNLVANFTNVTNSLYDLDQTQGQVNNVLADISEVDTHIDDYIANIDISDVKQLAKDIDQPEVDQLIEQLESGIENLEQKSTEINVDSEQQTADQISANLTQFINVTWPNIQSQILNVQTTLADLKTDYNSVAKYLTKDGDKAKTFMESPVNLNEQKLYPVANYGSASMPFYTTLCLWVGSLLMASLLSFHSSVKSSNSSEYVGKLLLFTTIGILQAIIVAVGDIKLLDITIASPVALVGYSIMLSIIFTIIIFSIVYSFGNIGKAICIILLVLSISGGGGNFPIEVSGQFYNNIYPWLPFTYGVKLLREAGAGIYQPTVNLCLIRLSMFGIGSLIFGLFFANTIKPVMDKFEIKSRENNIIH